MTKDCKQCSNQIEDKYIYCVDCLKAFRERQDKSPEEFKKTTGHSSTGQWHPDPLIDQLMKINSNLGKIANNLDDIATIIDVNGTERAVDQGFRSLIEELTINHRLR